MDIETTRNKLGWWAVALLLFALIGSAFYLLVLLLTFPGALFMIIMASTVLSAAAFACKKRMDARLQVAGIEG